jgi:condensin complex subunit 1
MLMLHEHLAAPLASSISNLEETDGNAGLLQLILTEVSGESEITPKAGSNFASFIISLSVENPKSLAKHLELLTDIVESEVCIPLFSPLLLNNLKQPYTLRCGILEAAKNLIVSLYSGNDLTENQIGEKNMLFDMLENHLIDVNAYCRCRVRRSNFFLLGNWQ